MKTSLKAGTAERERRRRMENWIDPGKETQTLVPRPRPESCRLATNRRGEGRLEIKRGFLTSEINNFESAGER
jgi:hypothetical protein